MTERLALFPLSTVLYPGLVMPLHIFEQRYRTLVRELLDKPADEPREFGVVAIVTGGEAKADQPPVLYDIGTSAELRQVNELEDGRFELTTTGSRRFRVLAVDVESHPYLSADIEWLDDSTADSAPPALVNMVLSRFREYQQIFTGADEELSQSLPDDPSVLSYLVSAALVLELREKQKLLAADDVVARLRLAASLLRRETVLIRELHAIPAINLLRE